MLVLVYEVRFIKTDSTCRCEHAQSFQIGCVSKMICKMVIWIKWTWGRLFISFTSSKSPFHLTFIHNQHFEILSLAIMPGHVSHIRTFFTTFNRRQNVKTQGSKFNLRASWKHFPLPPLSQCWFFYFLDCTGHSAYTTLNWSAWSISSINATCK